MTIQQTFEVALQHHQSGRLAEAEVLYRQILAAEPRHADALHLLGVIAHQVGRNDAAVDMIRQAIALAPDTPEFHSNLGEAYRALGQTDEAINAYHQAIALKPDYPEACNNLGVALNGQGKTDEAIAACRRAIALMPNYPEAHYNLGNDLKDKGELDEAIAAYRQAIALKYDYSEAHNNLGLALKEHGKTDEAIAALRQAIAFNPNDPEVHSNLGMALKDKGQLEEAIAAFRQAVALNPNLPEAHLNLGAALRDKGSLDDVITAYRQAIALDPNLPEAHNHLGIALYEKGQLDEAITTYRRAIALKPSFLEGHYNLCTALRDTGQLDEAVAACRQAIALNTDFSEVHSNLLLTLTCHPGCDARAIAAEQQLWSQRHAEPLRQFIQAHRNNCRPDRRLRIGYVSPDFRDHPVGRFLLPLLAQHDRQNFEIFCYAQVPTPDEMTRQLRAHADQWRSLAGLTDEQAAKLIRDDQIDILVDLALHTANNRLLVFARKPAPVQVTYLAYVGSSGLSAMDYRLSDPYLDPPDADESVYSEQTLRLAQTYWCFQPPNAPPIASAPVIESGHITFGCLNQFCKVNEPALKTWARLLEAVANSQLLLHAMEGLPRRQTADLLQHLGIDPLRLRFVGKLPLSEYLQLYGQIDIALDPFPYGGGTTTCDALWMGVPVISLRGNTAVGRAGLSLLTNIGLPDLVARTTGEYVQIATALANNLPRLTNLRRTLRQRMENSPLMDAPRFARDIEAAYRRMWEDWCARKT